MSSHKISGRYAKSILDLAQDNNQLEAVYQDMLTFANVSENRDFALMLKSPVIKADTKIQIVRSLLGGKINALTQSFVELLINKGRESILAEICVAFIEQYKVKNKVRTAILTTASQMDQTQLSAIQDQFKSWLSAGETMEVTQKIKPELVGGFIFEMGDQQYDSSAKRQVDLMKKNLYDKSYINLVVKS
ncbi:MAG TPA: ATP synthase F1 subunit delta [Saprospiraceae bacterium]|nr:ATP synthase F1 subunit delta [Saprospiraceae bacterium]